MFRGRRFAVTFSLFLGGVGQFGGWMALRRPHFQRHICHRLFPFLILMYHFLSLSLSLGPHSPYHQVYRLVCVDENTGQCSGIVTLSDLLNYFVATPASGISN